MSTHAIRAGGFSGDPVEALNPPALASGCCGPAMPAATAAEAESAQVSTCCGTVAGAQAEGSCCGAVAK